VVPANRKPTLCVINFNGERFLRDTLAAALAEGGSFTEILMVDNASTDSSVELVRREFPSVGIVEMPDNRGPGAARNAGLRHAAVDLVLFADNDVSVAPGCAERLVDALARFPEAAIAAPRVLYAHNREIIQYDGADNHFMGFMATHNQDLPLRGADRAVRRVGSVITACFMLDRSRLPDNDLFDETFFIYFEDHDFGVRMRALGCEIISVPEAICYHAEGSAGLSLRREGKYTSMRVFCLIRNRWLFILKTYTLRSMLLLSPLFLLCEAAQLLIAIKKGWFGEWCRAFGWVFSNFGEIMRKRRRLQHARKVPDRQLMIGGRIPFRQELTVSSIELGSRRVLDCIVMGYWRLVAPMI
jgi:GT2 family glycosyltransferase